MKTRIYAAPAIEWLKQLGRYALLNHNIYIIRRTPLLHDNLPTSTLSATTASINHSFKLVKLLVL